MFVGLVSRVACLALVVCGAALGPVSFAQGLPVDESRLAPALDSFGQYFKSAVREKGVVGASVLLMKDNGVLARIHAGMANTAEKRLVDDATIFHWASITKTFTGIAVMQLRDRGRLKLGDPIVKYLPELRGVHNPFGPMEEITLRHLMSHSAGFRSATWPWGGDEPWHPHEPLHWQQLVAMIPYTEILFKPGSKYSYSNPGIVFLGRVIEQLTTDDYEVYVDKNIFKPLEMHRSYFDTTPYHLQKHRAQSYFLRKGEVVAARPDHNTGITVSNGGLNAPIEDMVKYLRFIVGDPDRAEVYDGILRRSSLEEMWQPQVRVTEGDGGNSWMGLTYFVEDHQGMRFVAHSGGQNAFISHFYVSVPLKAAYIVAFNTIGDPPLKDGPGDTRALDRNIRDYLFRRVFPLLGKTGGEK